MVILRNGVLTDLTTDVLGPFLMNVKRVTCPMTTITVMTNVTSSRVGRMTTPSATFASLRPGKTASGEVNMMTALSFPESSSLDAYELGHGKVDEDIRLLNRVEGR